MHTLHICSLSADEKQVHQIVFTLHLTTHTQGPDEVSKQSKGEALNSSTTAGLHKEVLTR